LKTDVQMIQQLLAATHFARQGRLAEATALIQRSLAGEGAPRASELGAMPPQPATRANAPVSFDTRALFERLRIKMPPEVTPQLATPPFAHGSTPTRRRPRLV
jgi:hypothetical protein